MDVDKFIDKAEQALRRRAPDQAIALYRQVLVASPGHAAARQGLMSAYRKRAELKGGPSMLDRAAAKSLHAAALGLRGGKKWEAVAKSCDAALEKAPADAGLLALLAEALEALDRGPEALAVWRAQLDADENDLTALKAAGRLHYQQRQIAEAMECLERAHRLDARDPEIERLRKNLAAEGTLAATRYETATSSRDVIKDKDAVRRAEQAGRVHRDAAQLGADIDALRARFDGEPASADLRRRLVKALTAAGRHDEVLAVLDRAADALPGDEALADERGDAALAANEAGLRAAQAAGDASALARLKDERTELEIAEYGRRAQLHPGDAGVRLRLGRACYRAQRTEEAMAAFQAAMADPRCKLEAQQGLGACFVRKGLFPLAQRQFEAALEAAGGVGSERGKEICYHLGLVAERMNDRPGALSRYLAIYEVDINYRDVAGKLDELKT